MLGKIAKRAGVATLLIFMAIGCADNGKVTEPQAGAMFSATLFDIYDPSMISGPPMRSSNPSGEGTFILNEDGTALSFDVSFGFFFGAEFEGARFYLPPMLPSGQTVRTIQPPEVSGNTIRGVWKNTDSEPLTPTLVDSLIAGNIFIEVVAKDSTGLDIGQLLPTP